MVKKLVVALVMATLIMNVVGCTQSGSPATQSASPATQSASPATQSASPATQSDVVAISLGWQENESGQRFAQGFIAGCTELGWKYVLSNANYDPKLQSDQIDAFIKMHPKALFITASDPIGITAAVQRAIDAGIPVFLADSYIAGVKAVTSIASNNFGMGMYTMKYIAKAIGGKGKVGMINLPNNETWDLRTLGALVALKDYPDIQVVSWAYDPTGAVTPRQGVENMLTANPDIKAVWCSWDGAAMEGALAAQAHGMNNVIFTGIDGGPRAFEQIQAGGPFKLTCAQSFYWMAYMDVMYAKDYLEGKKVPRFVVSPVYAVTKEVLDAVPASLKATDYDMPGMDVKLNWTPVL